MKERYRILKYPLPIQDEVVLEIRGYVDSLLHVGEQHGTLYLWALVCPSEDVLHKRRLWILGTGNPIEDDGWGNYQPTGHSHVGTVQMSDGYVWHVFDGGPIIEEEKR